MLDDHVGCFCPSKCIVLSMVSHQWCVDSFDHLHSSFWSFLLYQAIWIFSCITYKPLTYGDYEYSPLGQTLGWFLAMSSVCCVPGTMVYLLAKENGTIIEVGQLLGEVHPRRLKKRHWHSWAPGSTFRGCQMGKYWSNHLLWLWNVVCRKVVFKEKSIWVFMLGAKWILCTKK